MAKSGISRFLDPILVKVATALNDALVLQSTDNSNNNYLVLLQNDVGVTVGCWSVGTGIGLTGGAGAIANLAHLSEFGTGIGLPGSAEPGTVRFLISAALRAKLNATGLALGGSDPATDAELDLQSTDKAMLVNRLTTTQRDALTPSDGMVIYNTTTLQFEGRANGAWVALH